MDDASLHREAQMLAARINKRIRDLGVGLGDNDMVFALVDEIAYGWDYVDVTTFGSFSPEVALTVYHPERRR